MRGTMFAAYELLRAMGCEFLAHDYTVRAARGG
jgi:hypothetical protein